MPVYQLGQALVFPDPEWANPEGVLAVGGDLRVERLLLAYHQGIFPWYEEGSPIVWWSPPSRCVLHPEEFHASRSLKRLIRQERFAISLDRAFGPVIRACAETRLAKGQDTWITRDMVEAYCALHEAGFAHSVEVWDGRRLAGGMYGVSLGGAFFGESMFSRVSNASKVAFFSLTRQLEEWGFSLFDCQISNPHLHSLGAYDIPRAEFLARLSQALSRPTRRGSWG